MMKNLWFACALIVLSQPALARQPAPATLESTARALYLQDNLDADLDSPEMNKAVATIKEEVEAVLDQFIQSGSQGAFYTYEPFVRGQIVVRFSDSISGKLIPLLDEKGEFDATQPTGMSALDQLNKKWNIISYSKPYKFSPSLTLTFSKKQNPHPVAAAFKEVAGTKYAVPNGLSYIGGGIELKRISVTNRTRNRLPTLYVLSIGWGDCPAGCMAVHRIYVEVTHDIQQVKVAKVGSAGTPLTPELKQRYLK